MTTVELMLGEPAAGGGFVARDPGGRVVFVRHGISGERVIASITEEHPTWARADVVEVLEASPDRVETPCMYAGAGGCGGCDYQHIALPAQRRIKTRLLAAQLHGVAGMAADVVVEPVTEDAGGLATRTRVRFAVDPDGHLAMHRHRSHDLVAVERCALGVARITSHDLAARRWTPRSEVEITSLAGSEAPTVVTTLVEAAPGPPGARRRTTEVLDEPGFAARQSTSVRDATYTVSAGVFWQVHERAAGLLVDEVLSGLELAAGDRVVDLYCGAGLFTRATGAVVGPTGSVVGIDGSRAAIADARVNLDGLAWAKVSASRVDRRSVERVTGDATHVVLDPPRNGADRGALVAVGAAETVRRVVSVSCDAATFARDLRILVDAGFSVRSVRAFDLFEMTEHFEIVAVLER